MCSCELHWNVTAACTCNCPHTTDERAETMNVTQILPEPKHEPSALESAATLILFILGATMLAVSPAVVIWVWASLL